MLFCNALCGGKRQNTAVSFVIQNRLSCCSSILQYIASRYFCKSIMNHVAAIAEILSLVRYDIIFCAHCVSRRRHSLFVVCAHFYFLYASLTCSDTCHTHHTVFICMQTWLALCACVLSILCHAICLTNGMCGHAMPGYFYSFGLVCFGFFLMCLYIVPFK